MQPAAPEADLIEEDDRAGREPRMSAPRRRRMCERRRRVNGGSTAGQRRSPAIGGASRAPGVRSRDAAAPAGRRTLERAPATGPAPLSPIRIV
jgi:hypothetical protein